MPAQSLLWMCNGHLRCCLSTVSSCPSQLKSVPPSGSPILAGGSSILPTVQAKSLGVIFNSFFSSVHIQPISKPQTSFQRMRSLLPTCTPPLQSSQPSSFTRDFYSSFLLASWNLWSFHNTISKIVFITCKSNHIASPLRIRSGSPFYLVLCDLVPCDCSDPRSLCSNPTGLAAVPRTSQAHVRLRTFALAYFLYLE